MTMFYDATWNSWTSGTSATSSCAISTSSDTTWTSWTSGTSATDNTAWYYWIDGNIYAGQQSQAPQYSEEELAQIRQRREEQRQRMEAERQERERQQKEADKKADQLLKSLLSPEQIAQLDELSAFIITTPKGNTYRIKRGWAGNIEKIDRDGQATDRFCIHPKISVPYADNMATQKLMLETNEDEFLRVANRTILHRP